MGQRGRQVDVPVRGLDLGTLDWRSPAGLGLADVEAAGKGCVPKGLMLLPRKRRVEGSR